MWSMRVCRLWLVLVFVIGLCVGGCSLLPSHKKRSQTLAATQDLAGASALQVERITEGSPAPNITVSGNTFSLTPAPAVPAAVEGSRVPSPHLGVSPPSIDSYLGALAAGVPYRQTVRLGATNSQRLASAEAASGASSVKVPLWVNLLGFGVALVVVLWALKAWRRSSAAAAAAMSAGDQALAGLVRKVREKATAETDPVKLAELNASLAELEGTRGRLVAS